ncbi:hypothetical protein CR194_07590 [Salipaludibacillus keqinensis]|uniref:Uncharacterized protein n=1 Tax=Salipaludibacillus keqinensis TaxID=2045207 RepID=A0A323TCK1_9BACI|nr:hypothetical protein [Salipaludibacillus keqinensis]PYZ93052.1 hypothetical protein CR194_07590 [Salipaludibacillus keqinensis]
MAEDKRGMEKLNQFSINDLYKGKNLDIIAAALLLTGKLKVDSVEIFRGSPTVSVGLVGEYRIPSNKKVNKMVDFMDQNGDMTIDEIFEAFQTRMKKKE